MTKPTTSDDFRLIEVLSEVRDYGKLLDGLRESVQRVFGVDSKLLRQSSAALAGIFGHPYAGACAEFERRVEALALRFRLDLDVARTRFTRLVAAGPWTSEQAYWGVIDGDPIALAYMHGQEATLPWGRSVDGVLDRQRRVP